jgi:enterochelin esterase-like enzyme
MAGRLRALILTSQQANETTGDVIRMVKASIRVHRGVARFDVAVLANSVQQAVGLVMKRYPNCDVQVGFLTGLAGFSMGDTAALTDGYLHPNALTA